MLFLITDMGTSAEQSFPAILKAAVQDDNERVRKTAGQALLRVAGRSRLDAMLESPDDPHRLAAIRAVSLIGGDKRLVELLIPSLKHANPHVRAEAANVLGRYGWVAIPAIPTLVELLEDSFDEVKNGARYALTNIIRAIESSATEVDAEIVGKAEKALEKLR